MFELPLCLCHLHRLLALQLNFLNLGLKFSVMKSSNLSVRCRTIPVNSNRCLTWIVKEFSDLLVPFITLLFNKSLDSGQYPQRFKHAVVWPLSKNLDPTQLNNYKPVSNLSFLSKLLKKAISERSRQQLKKIDGIPKHQLVYRKRHSTETAIGN